MYLGGIKIKHNLQIKLGEQIFGALLFEDTLRKVREIKGMMKFESLLLALTHDPIISINYHLEDGVFKRIVNLIHDYVSSSIGIVSFFKIEGEISIMVTAHGLGHSQGLSHHLEPIDLMYVGLLKTKWIKYFGFCDDCKRQLEKK